MSLGLWLAFAHWEKMMNNLLWKCTLATTQSYNSYGILQPLPGCAVSRLEAHTIEQGEGRPLQEASLPRG